MAMAIECVYFRHVDVHPDRIFDECKICWEPLGLKALAHHEDKEPHIFHKSCLFGWLRHKESCPECLHPITTPPPFFYYYLFPNFRITYPNTEPNQWTVAKKVTEVYSFFLTKLGHRGPVHQRLVQLGVRLEEFLKGEVGVSSKQIEIFSRCLINEIKNHLDHPGKRKNIHLNYGPRSSGILFEVFQRAGIDWDRYACYLPRHTKILLRASEERIELKADFKCFFDNERRIEVELHD